MKVTYVGFGDFHRFAGMKQLYHFGQETCRHGHQAQILIAGSVSTVRSMSEPPLTEIIELKFTGPLLDTSVRQRITSFSPDIVHVWTPRHVPALAGWQVHRLTGARIILDHEDDEDYHLRYMRRSWTQNWSDGWRRLAWPAVVARNSASPWIRPLNADGSARRPAMDGITASRIASAASAHTAISPNLVRWVERRWSGKPVYLLYPGADFQLFGPRSRDTGLEKELRLSGRSVLAYSGTMSFEIFCWFMAVLRGVVDRRPNAKLILVGEDGFRSTAEALARELGLDDAYILKGQVPYGDVPRYLSLADVLVQHPIDQANALRLPAKIPEYLAMGKPVITFASGIGSSLQDGLHVRKLYSDNPEEAVALVLELLNDPTQRETLGRNARALAIERFDWSRNGQRLIEIYQETMRHDLDARVRA